MQAIQNMQVMVMRGMIHQNHMYWLVEDILRMSWPSNNRTLCTKINTNPFKRVSKIPKYALVASREGELPKSCGLWTVSSQLKLKLDKMLALGACRQQKDSHVPQHKICGKCIMH